MSVEQYGARLLGEVQEESLDELLINLRAIVNPQPKDILAFSQLDKFLDFLRYPQHHSPPRRPGWTSTSYAGAGSNDDEVDVYSDEEAETFNRPPAVRSRPPIIQFTSTKSATGKTSLLYYLTALALLPIEYGGKQSAVVWLDTDNTFSASRLAQILSHVISTSTHISKAKSLESIDSITSTALSHLSILKPTSSTVLLAALHSLPEYILTQTSRTSPTRPLGLLVLDSATTFHHQDRFDAEIARLSAVPGVGTSTSTSTSTALSRTSQTITAVKKIQSEFECTVIFTTTTQPQPQLRSQVHPHAQARPRATYIQQRQSDDGPSIPQQSPIVSPWTSFATLSMTMSRIMVPPFSPLMTLEECLKDRDRRQDAVKKARFAVSVDAGTSGFRDVGRTIDSGIMKGFVLRVGEEGVAVEE